VRRHRSGMVFAAAPAAGPRGTRRPLGTATPRLFPLPRITRDDGGVLFRRPVLDAIARGEVTLAFRRWQRPSVRAGTVLRTPIGELEVTSIDPVPLASISADDAHRAGAASRAALLAGLREREGATYRIGLRWRGGDRRIELREQPAASPEERSALHARVAAIDARSRRGPWTRPVLELLRDHPGVRAAELAVRCGRETLPFKADVRRLKELGLTESLEVGYRLSPRGAAYLADVADGLD